MQSMSKCLQTKATKKKDARDDGRLELNLAMAKYYEKKAEKLDLEIQLLKKEISDKDNNSLTFFLFFKLFK